MLGKIRDLQNAIDSVGLGSKTLSLPVSSVEDFQIEDRNGVSLFDEYTAVIDDPEIISVTRDLFASGFHSSAVDAAFKLLDE